MKLPIYQVDAFANKLFEGNPAAVIPLESWLEDEVLQSIAQENNLSETAFIVKADIGYELRWFTPKDEVDLCGHATLATAHVLYEHLDYEDESISFHTRSGILQVSRTAQGYSMDFPASVLEEIPAPLALVGGLKNVEPVQVLAAFDYVVVLDNEAQVRALEPDLNAWRKLDRRGVVVTAKGDKVDFVSRCFFPKLNVDEDPVTGSAHCELAPYWSKRLDKVQLCAAQISQRSGTILCEVKNERVVLIGSAVDYMQGEINYKTG
ncbi:PhzF family phenazine biosynthesis protein [Pseudoalteromonas sp. S16_S37]|uniref:PhzF family phenazine biosynthesis protein n=1 Tax=Pseudoalteromonas sp. S16_S37 TaxID=2720228 RepID=UPI0016816D39|nr:PhzF family phenazine biosynthesis protein [Pseudoalteromonas sp. S16_S37]MBD1584786.1 PhzF family phenazine biosynthesis protein [Pseudoalteromonas sp. S16_S37]